MKESYYFIEQKSLSYHFRVVGANLICCIITVRTNFTDSNSTSFLTNSTYYSEVIASCFQNILFHFKSRTFLPQISLFTSWAAFKSPQQFVNRVILVSSFLFLIFRRQLNKNKAHIRTTMSHSWTSFEKRGSTRQSHSNAGHNGATCFPF